MKFFKTAQGRSSMFLAIKAIARKDRTHIITQAFTCSAVPEAIIISGYKPFWLDIELETFSIDVDKYINELQNNSSKFAAIFIQHTFGLMPKNYEKIKQISYENNIPVIEDRCHCNFLHDFKEIKSKKITNKLAYCYSFENAKPINLGRGGLLMVSDLSKEELFNIKESLKTFKNQNLFNSLFHLLISISYIFFYKTIFYWYLLAIYKRFAALGLMPSNFNKFLLDFKFEKIGFFQNLILTNLINIVKRNKKDSIVTKFIVKYYIDKINRFPLYVNNKEEVLIFCRKNFIQVKDFFNTPIQPIQPKDYKKVGYYQDKCLKAEEASKHIISFDKKPKDSLLSKLKSFTS